MRQFNSDTVMNFRIPISLKNEFQTICDNYHVSMSHRLNDFVRDYVNEVRKTDKENTTLKSGNQKQWVKQRIGGWRDELLSGY